MTSEVYQVDFEPPTVPVSVVIPVWRGGDLMEQAIASAFHQTARPQEAILVDDASDDDTVSRIERLQAQYPAGWLNLIRQPSNLGPASARNRGWDAAGGKYLAFLDADDFWHPQKIEFQVAQFYKDADLSLTGVPVCHIKSLEPKKKDDLESARIRRVTFQAQLFRNRFATSGVMLSRNLRSRFVERTFHSEDSLLWSTIIGEGYKAQVCDVALAANRKTPFGESGLSANLRAMYRGQKHNHQALYSAGLIGKPRKVALDGWSWMRHVLRHLRVQARSNHAGLIGLRME